MINGGSRCNVFWQVGSSATLGTTTSFTGNILALTSITLTTGATVAGRALARNGAVTLDSNNVSPSSCLAGCPVITISPATLPTGFVGVPYSQTLTPSGGTAPYVFTVAAGTLPPGLTLTPGGVLSGTPTAQGTFPVTIRATDAHGCVADRPYSILVVPPVPTLPQVFAVLLALGLVAIGYLRLQRRTRTE
jgi:type VI secretion system secreted protein VgrG